jgi:hypothetical protein
MSCPACFTGSLDSGTPTGKEITVGGVPTYLASPPEGSSTAPSHAILIITDIFGWKVSNLSHLNANSLSIALRIDVLAFSPTT